MQLRSLHNGGIVTVDSAFGKRLIEGGGFVEADAPIKTTRKTRTKTAPAPVEEQKTEE